MCNSLLLLLIMLSHRRPQEGTVTAHDIQFSTLVEDPQFFPFGVPSPYQPPLLHKCLSNMLTECEPIEL
jgi:hypothetical protein